MSFDDLPTEMLQTIFSFTSLNDLKTIGLVCQRWAAAMEPMLLARTHLSVFRRVEEPPRRMPSRMYHYDDDDDYSGRFASSSSAQLIDKKILMGSNRNYSRLRIDWSNERSEPDQRALQEVLDVCQERFSVQKLYLKTPFGKALANLLNNHRKLLENLTEICFEQCGPSSELSANGPVFLELSLPNLKQLAWHETGSHHRSTNPSYHHQLAAMARAQDMAINHPRVALGGYAYARLDDDYYTTSSTNHVSTDTKLYITLHAPKLNRLKVRANTTNYLNRPVYLGLEHANQCCLFLPSLNLKSCSNLQHIEISEIADLDESVIDHSAAVLQNVKSLTFFKCYSQVMVKLFAKCSKLETLNVHSTSHNNLQFFSMLPRSLQKLSLTNFSSFSEDDQAVLPELRFIRLDDIKTPTDRNKISLDAPKLETIISSQKSYNLFKITQKKQIRTMVVEFNRFYRHDTPPPPNVTELFLCIKLEYDDEHVTVQDYLRHFPNLRRLTVFGKQGPSKDGEVELSLVHFPQLEYLCADGVTLRMADFHELTRLKSLTLSDCILKTNQEEAVLLRELQYLRVRLVVTEEEMGDGADRARNLFPICGGGDTWLPVVKLSTRIFGSPDFQLKQWHQLIPTN